MIYSRAWAFTRNLARTNNFNNKLKETRFKLVSCWLTSARQLYSLLRVRHQLVHRPPCSTAFSDMILVGQQRGSQIIGTQLVLFTSRLGAWHPWTRGSSLQETAKKPPRSSSLESSRLVDPCPSRLESPRGSSRLVDPCSSRQELDAKRLEPARGIPGLESARLVHNTKHNSNPNY